jgi:Tol biopolymer transport system component/tRNA A-37 threonylcarbamoyl transferase component Bud32
LNRWQQIESLFQEALRHPIEERDAWLREACGTDTELHREVASLLANHHESAGAGPWAAAAAQLIVKPVLLEPGQFLGPYKIVSFLAAGGMGEVYRARDTKLKRDVALKVLPEKLARDPGRMARFQREAEVLASLNHPNIAHIYGVEERALVMEFVEGESPKGPQPFEEAWKIALQIADALEYAHERGVIHRDLKPANVKVTPDGVVKLLDFGLAKAFSETPEAASLDPENSPTVTLGATVAGTVMGTAAYMSPEQAKGKRVDKRADIWSWGVVLYELLTGERLFKGDEAADTLAQVLTEEPDWDRAPVRVQRLLQRCLEKDPKQRLRDIGEARHLLDKSPAPPEPVTAPKLFWLAWTAAAVLALTTAGFAALWLRPAPLPQVTRFEIHAPPGSTLPLGTPAITPDGRTIAFTVNDPDGQTRIHLRPVDRIETRALPDTEGAVHPFWSPDGRFLAFVAFTFPQRQRHLRRIDVAGGAARDLGEATAPWQGTWSRNGEILCDCGGAMSRIAAEGGGLPTPIPRGKEDTEITHPYFLQDGKRFLVHVNAETSSIQLARLGSTERTMVLDNAESAPILAPTPQGKIYLLYLRESDLFGQEFEERSGMLRGKPVLVVSNVGSVTGPAITAAVGVSPAGILAYQSGGEFATGQLTWFDRSGRPVGALPVDASGTSAHISPDGSLLAASKFGASGRSIWVTDLARKSSSPITFGRNDILPAWSPSGKRLAFFRVVGKDAGVHVVDWPDASKDRFLKGAVDAPTSWSPDEKYLLVGMRTGRMTLIALDESQKPIPVGSRKGSSRQGRMSPNGKFIAFTSNESGRYEIYVRPMPPATGYQKVSINGGQSPRWRGDGKELFFVSPDAEMMAVDITPDPVFHAGVPHRLFPLKSADPNDLAGYDVRRDGQQFLIFMRQRSTQDAPITVVLNWWAELRQEP